MQEANSPGDLRMSTSHLVDFFFFFQDSLCFHCRFLIDIALDTHVEDVGMEGLVNRWLICWCQSGKAVAGCDRGRGVTNYAEGMENSARH